MSNDYTQDTTPATDVPLTKAELRALVRGVVRFSAIFQSARRLGFGPQLFNGPDENPLRVFISVYSVLFDRHAGVVTHDMFLTEVSARAEDNYAGLTTRDIDVLFGAATDNAPGLIDYAFSSQQENLTAEQRTAERRHVETILRRFLNARLLGSDIKRFVSTSDGNASPLELVERLDSFKKQAQNIRFLGNEATNAADMPDFGGDIVLPPPPRPTTISWIDNYIGGFRTGDIIGVLGPYSGGKTTMLSAVAVRQAQQYAAMDENKLSVYVCYEDGAQKVNYSLYSAAAHIARDTFLANLDGASFWENLSTQETLKDYERQLPVNRNGDVLLSERQRWELARPWFNRHFVFLDFSCNPETGGRGNGGVLEIAESLENLREQTGMEIGCLCLDYAGLMLMRALNQNERTKHQEQIWREMQELPNSLKIEIGTKFDCTILVAHQLAGGDIKKIPPYRYVTHYDAQGSKAFAENLHACLCVNQKDPENFVSTINWSKIRYGRPASPYGLVRIHDTVVDVEDVSEDYYVNELGRKITRRDDMAPTAHNAAVVAPPAGRRVIPNTGFDVDTFGQDFLS